MKKQHKPQRNNSVRNQKCPCGSGKKYKNCCYEKDVQARREAEMLKQNHEANSVPDEEDEPRPALKYPTWKVFVAGIVCLGAVSLLLYFLSFKLIAGALFGCGMLILIVFCAFRDVPPLRKNPGNGGNIDFGTRG